MLIECPSCQTQAQLAGGKRGVKVRCANCGATYRIRARETTPSGLFWGLGVALVTAIVLFLLSRRADDPAPIEEVIAKEAPEEQSEPAPLPGDGWESLPVQAANRIHELAGAQDRAGLYPFLDETRLLQGGRFDALGKGVDQLLQSEDEFAVRFWKPIDGEVIAVDEPRVTVRLACIPRNPQALPEEERYAKRWFDWELAMQPRTNAWRAFTWQRWISPQEIHAERIRSEAVVLSDGSRVIERIGEHQEHLPETSPELAAKIEELVATMLDLDLTRESARAQADLVAIGKPAIPALLNGLYAETPMETQDDAIKCNMLVQSLRRITGRSFGFRPQLLEGSSLGTTPERRSSSVRQWFAWWSMHQDDFEGLPDPEDIEEQ